MLDRERDRHHPVKRLRPVASGALPVAIALAAALAMLAAGLWLCGQLAAEGRSSWNGPLGAAVSYVGLTFLYSLVLSRIAFLDVAAIAFGFLLRAVGGGLAIGVEVSSWLLLATYFVALFLALGKRRSELRGVVDGGESPARPSLLGYERETLDVLLAAAAAVLLLCYALYTVDERTVHEFGGRGLFLTVPIVVYGAARYLALSIRSSLAEDPARLLLRDRPLLAAFLAWCAVVLAVVYGPL